ncbi:SHOCT domain-containing protein [Streptomyces sp. NBC_01465]|uniref:SHOCT domain-containing protein n=1 Tax=Streptomyces sp. NBC_01465 TaxID=2903878 RepID=UPI002E3727B4|nr:SHOCT domain-containing protein [Streptomyces sp. NBC_01465]
MFIRPMRPMVRPVMRPRGAPLLRGALVGGAAYAVGKNNARRAQNEQDQNAAIQDLQAQQSQPQYQQPMPAVAPAPAAPASGGDVADRLAQLGQMAQQGLLTPEEFAAAKAKLLGV